MICGVQKSDKFLFLIFFVLICKFFGFLNFWFWVHFFCSFLKNTKLLGVHKRLQIIFFCEKIFRKQNKTHKTLLMSTHNQRRGGRGGRGGSPAGTQVCSRTCLTHIPRISSLRTCTRTCTRRCTRTCIRTVMHTHYCQVQRRACVALCCMHTHRHAHTHFPRNHRTYRQQRARKFSRAKTALWCFSTTKRADSGYHALPQPTGESNREEEAQEMHCAKPFAQSSGRGVGGEKRRGKKI